ncbi:hypothetical protein [Bdellovibrio sp. ArHS]|uniref:hypothetical protein n=1 Tax=Bdellovibrio sp. ArHS TaxID=1569284 RepID=UPI000B282B10|nr:hypothetical protein [Bdellovibrio sp. ArHS]
MALNLSELQGERRVEYRSPQGLAEVCVIPKKWPGASYRADDVEKENDLCSYDFHSNMGICPKYTSTNPAILILKPNASYSKDAIDASNCDVKKMGVKTEAKFKQSVTCSYTPGILAYYPISRILGNVGRVPVAVIRSMDRDIHARLTDKAIANLQNSPYEIKSSWAAMGRIHKTPGNYPTVVDNSLSQLYGALSDNIKNEEQYMEVSGNGPYETRYQRFLQQPPFQKVASSQSVEQIVGTKDFASVAQTVTQMKDVSDLVLLDTLMNQQDRIGNIHYKFYWYAANPSSMKIERMKSEAKWVGNQLQVPQAEKDAMAGKQAALIKEMVLKDNDCAIIKTNMMRRVNALEQVRHISYSTYRRFLAFERTLKDAYTKDYFTREMLFTSNDYAVLVGNATKAKQILLSKCQAGELHFDVDLETYIPGASKPAYRCDL